MSDYLSDASKDVKIYFETHKIPIYFYQCLFGELIKIWGMCLFAPDPNYDAEYDDEGNMLPSNGKYSYKDQIYDYLTVEGGTGGWNVAFYESCAQCDLAWLAQDYDSLDWVQSDIFNGYIVDRLVDVAFDGNATNDYYLYKINKSDEQTDGFVNKL